MIKYLPKGMLLLSLSLLALCSCGGEKKSQDSAVDKLEWDSVSYKKSILFDNDSVRYEFDAVFCYPKNDSTIYNLCKMELYGSEDLEFGLDSILPRWAMNHISHIELHSVAEMDSLEAKGEHADYGLRENYEYALKNRVLYESTECVSIEFFSFAYSGGVHGLEAYGHLVYDKQKNAIITEEDLFAEKNWGDFEEVFTKQVEATLKKEYKELIGDDGFFSEAKPNNNFYLTDKSIIYRFNPYEIGPYAMGTPTLEIPYDMLKNIVKEDSPIARILKRQNKWE